MDNPLHGMPRIDPDNGIYAVRRTVSIAGPKPPAPPRPPWPPEHGATLAAKVDAAEQHLRSQMAGAYTTAFAPLYSVVRELAEQLDAMQTACADFLAGEL